MKSFSIGTFVVLCLILLRISPADSYVYPGPVLLEKMIRSMGEARSLTVENEIVLHPSEDPSADGPVAFAMSETVHYRFPDAFFSQTRSAASEKILVVAPGGSVTVFDGLVQSESETRFDEYKDPLLYRSSAILSEKLAKIGMNVGVSSLGRFENRVVFVVGALYPDLSVSQLWIDKKTFRPTRLILFGIDPGRQKGGLDIRYRDWKREDGLWHPMIVEFYRDGSLVAKRRAKSLDVGPRLDSSLFDIGRYLSEYALAPDKGDYSGKYEEIAEEVRRIVENFDRMRRKIY